MTLYTACHEHALGLMMADGGRKSGSARSLSPEQLFPPSPRVQTQHAGCFNIHMGRLAVAHTVLLSIHHPETLLLLRRQLSLPRGQAPHRKLLTCVVRLSPEKEPETFIALAAALHRSGALQRLSMTPLMLATAQTRYAEDLRSRFRSEVPAGQVVTHFLQPAQLAAVFAATRLNVHPCRYDAYGMTVVEAAAQGVPSVVHKVWHAPACRGKLCTCSTLCIAVVPAPAECRHAACMPAWCLHMSAWHRAIL